MNFNKSNITIARVWA
jgi:hypothetical protein